MRIVAFLLLGGIAFIALALYAVERGVPFVEGKQVTTVGSAWNFQIAASRAECAEIACDKNSDPGMMIVEYFKDGPVRWKTGRSVPIHDVSEVRSVFASADLVVLRYAAPHWYLNSLSLEFRDDKLVQITRSRWLWER